MASEVVHQLEPWSRLDGKIVMLTGASAGLGREFCLDLAKAGCKIVVAARRIDRLISLCHEINQQKVVGGGCDGCYRAIAVELDVMSDGGPIEAAVAEAWNAFGHIDVLINNAGVRGQVRSTLQVSEEDGNHVLKTNLIGTWLVSKCVASVMQAANRGGSIINISSESGLNRVISRGEIAYRSSKSSMDTMTRVMTLELGEYNIRVNTIAPGLFRSEITEALFQRNLDNMAKRIIPLQILDSTSPALTLLIRYLIHHSSRYVSGNIFIVDGGISLPGLAIYSSL